MGLLVVWSRVIGEDRIFFCEWHCIHTPFEVCRILITIAIGKDNVFMAFWIKTGDQRPVSWGACGAVQSLGLTGHCWPEGLHTYFMFSVCQVLCVEDCAVKVSKLGTVFQSPLPWGSQVRDGQNGICMRFERQKRASGYDFLKIFSGSYVVTDKTCPNSALRPVLPDSWPCWTIAAPSLPLDIGLYH